jgi:hypothetical protein
VRRDSQREPAWLLWIDWLDRFSLAYSGQNETVLIGQVNDQAALYGLIAKLRDLGVKLLTVNLGGQKKE